MPRMTGVDTIARINGPHGEHWPALGLGTWRLGESASHVQPDVATMRRALEIGYRLIDTAEMYGDGAAERVVGQAVTEALRQPGVARDELRVVSKFYPHHADAAGMKRACDASRRRLQLDTIDLYLLHWRGDIALQETLRGFQQLMELGWIRHWGVSNFDLADMQKLARLPLGADCASNQVYYSLSERGVEFDLLPWMRERGMPLMAYCPIDGGRLAAHPALGALAQPLGITATQLALAWLLEQPGVMAIPKAGREQHLLENWQCQALRLPPHVRAEIDALFAAPTRKRTLAMS
jgi:diketogulonate reductase-like aldo/keto reductase